jgi:hypothetical protein
MNAHSLLFQIFDESLPKQSYRRNNEEDGHNEEEQSIRGSQESHESSPDGKRQTIDDGKQAKYGIENEDA